PCDCPRVRLVRGDVVEPGRVSTEPGDTTGSEVDGPALEGSGAVLTVDGHRIFLPYGTVRDTALAEQVQRVADQTTSAQEAVNVVDETVTELGVDVTAAADEAHAAALAAAEASGTLVSPESDPLPAT